MLVRRAKRVDGSVPQRFAKLLPLLEQLLFLVQIRNRVFKPAHRPFMEPLHTQPVHHRGPAKGFHHALQPRMDLNLVEQTVDGRVRVRVLQQILPVQVGQAAQGLQGMSVSQQGNADQIEGHGDQLLLDFREQAVPAKKPEPIQELGFHGQNETRGRHGHWVRDENRPASPTSSAKS